MRLRIIPCLPFVPPLSLYLIATMLLNVMTDSVMHAVRCCAVPLRSLLLVAMIAIGGAPFGLNSVLANESIVDLESGSDAGVSELDLAESSDGDVQSEIELTDAELADCVSLASINPSCCERVFLFSTRHLPFDACRAPLEETPYKAWQIECGQSRSIEAQEYFASLRPDRPVVIYVHGNRMPASNIVNRAMQVRQTIKCNLDQPVDWLIFSWPSAQEGIAVHDVRRKADRCDAQSLYLATVMRAHVEAGTPLAVVGFSFGGRVVTGALHALAGGTLSGRTIPGPKIEGAAVDVGLVAPAIESNWLASCGYHRMATKNMDQLFLMYNRRDAVLKRYWLLEKVRSQTALGYSGPSSFAPRYDGTRLPVRSRDFSGSVRLRHVEMDYYENGCGCDFARLISDAGSQSY
ncbi:alpha/beta hydrolase [Stieleria sp. JC731]|uniref:alpha/beta hydrolase n=1 Tax=Pirellulaceae TaxID=2691357 RepID=UPI001E3A785E|nr:alpha/beta hydrolase [Stieleria sp. JC731]MCC9601380.1 alpha/beta hydrolase [Stieleria sp. JC731]